MTNPYEVNRLGFSFNARSQLRAIQDAYQKVIPSPLAQAAAMAAVGAGAAVVGKNVFSNAADTILAPIKSLLPGPSRQQQVEQYYRQQNMTQQQRLKQKARADRNAAIIGALSGAALSLFLHAQPDKPYFGLTKWAGLGFFQTDINYDKPVNRLTAMNLFKADQLLTANDPYAAAFGLSVVAAAGGPKNTTTLGTIYDSAVNKFQMQQQLNSFGRTALQTGKSYIAASLFTKALDTMVGLQPSVRKNLIGAGTWAGAISSIIH